MVSIVFMNHLELSLFSWTFHGPLSGQGICAQNWHVAWFRFPEKYAHTSVYIWCASGRGLREEGEGGEGGEEERGVGARVNYCACSDLVAPLVKL